MNSYQLAFRTHTHTFVHVCVCVCVCVHLTLRQGARLLRSWVRIPPGAWIFVCCECRVLSGRGLLRRADQSSRGVLPTVVRRCV